MNPADTSFQKIIEIYSAKLNSVTGYLKIKSRLVSYPIWIISRYIVKKALSAEKKVPFDSIL